MPPSWIFSYKMWNKLSASLCSLLQIFSDGNICIHCELL